MLKTHLKRLFIFICSLMFLAGTVFPRISGFGNTLKIESRNHILHVFPESSLILVSKVSGDTVFMVENTDYHSEFFLSDDGRYIIIVAWHYVQIDTINIKGVKKERFAGPTPFGPSWAVRIIDTKLRKEKEYLYSEICKQPRKKMFRGEPHGNFWWEWRDSVYIKGDSLVLQLPFNRTKSILYTQKSLIQMITEK